MSTDLTPPEQAALDAWNSVSPDTTGMLFAVRAALRVAGYPAEGGGSGRMTAARHLDDWLSKARLVRSLPDGEPWPAWSTGETLAVALIVGDEQRLADEGHTLVEALERLRYDIGEPSAGAALDVFLRLRSQLERP